jgi:hypothetical protein
MLPLSKFALKLTQSKWSLKWWNWRRRTGTELVYQCINKNRPGSQQWLVRARITDIKQTITRTHLFAAGSTRRLRISLMIHRFNVMASATSAFEPIFRVFRRFSSTASRTPFISDWWEIWVANSNILRSKSGAFTMSRMAWIAIRYGSHEDFPYAEPSHSYLHPLILEW